MEALKAVRMRMELTMDEDIRTNTMPLSNMDRHVQSKKAHGYNQWLQIYILHNICSNVAK